MIKIDIVPEAPGSAYSVEFDTALEAWDFLTRTSLLNDPQLAAFTWTQVKPCVHVWTPFGQDNEEVEFHCAYCSKDIKIEHEALTRAAHL